MSICGVVSSGVTDKLGSSVMWTVLPCLCVFVWGCEKQCD